MCDNRTVSVIIAAYNAERTLRAAAESVFAQTFADWELLICDDCSTDGTFELAQELAKLDARVRVLRNERNSRAAATRNRMIALAEGRYIAILDADDAMLPTRLTEQVEFLDAHTEYAYCASWYRLVYDDGSVAEPRRKLSGEVENREFLRGQCFCHPSTTFRADALCSMGGYRVDRTTDFRSEDYDLFMRMAARGMRGYVLPACLYEYYSGAEALKRRKYRYRWAEAKVRYVNFKRLGLMPLGLLYAARPMMVGLIPQALLQRLRQMKK